MTDMHWTWFQNGFCSFDNISMREKKYEIRIVSISIPSINRRIKWKTSRQLTDWLETNHSLSTINRSSSFNLFKLNASRIHQQNYSFFIALLTYQSVESVINNRLNECICVLSGHAHVMPIQFEPITRF